MTYKDMTVLREHSRLTVRIRRWKHQGRDVSELLNQREDLKNKTHKKDKTVAQTNHNNHQLLNQISTQLETLLNLLNEQKKEPINYDDLLTKLQANQQQFFQQLEKLINNKVIIAGKAKTEPEIKSRKLIVHQTKNQSLKIDLVELERETGIRKDWNNPAWKKAWKNKYNEIYNQLPSTLAKKRQRARKNGGR